MKAKLGADLRALPFHIVSGDARAAARRHQQGGKNSQQSGLARAVGADQGSDFTGSDLERNSQQRGMGQRRKRIEKRPHSGLRHRKILHHIFDDESAGCHVLSYTLSVRWPGHGDAQPVQEIMREAMTPALTPALTLDLTT